ncbi:S41 family peptidase [Myceligenerans salitolerans]|uniref:Tricorn protease homolog n=1 Tax=Myceligenerans salitolerans TaxID=1230528 RepID=A0ABS3I8C6_9MICO|nr:S41 family peptidase [Myceligenerans salitolerans]MBO0609189.1 PDZ domain-containing protein [Myceligenerans salitolerans]
MSRPYLRYPHLHEDLVTFVADDDVWLAPVAGGRAWRLTSDRVACATPRIAPGGSLVAYLSHRDGHPEVYVVDLDGGAPRRLTWFGGMRTLLLGWDGDGRVLVATSGAEHHRWLTVVHAVGLDGAVERLRFGPAWGVATHGSGVTALVSAGYRPAVHWKRYRGGTASRLWLDRSGDGAWEQALPEEEAAVLDPMWVGDTLLFTSDRAATFPDHADEQANLWAWDGLATTAPGQDPAGAPRRLTFQTAEEGYVRDATTDGARVVWHSRGDLWILDSLDGTPRRLDIALTGAAPRPYAARPARIDGLATDQGGDGSLVGWLGTAFWLTHRAGPARALVADPAVRVREPDLLGDTGRAVVVTDADGEDALEVHALDGAAPPVRFAGGALGRVLHLAAGPDGDRVATVSHDGRVSLVAAPVPGQAASPAITEVGRSDAGEAEGLAFSPDGRYLAWSTPTGNEGDHHRVMVADLREESPVGRPLTSGKFHDRCPAFTGDGKYLALLSDRTFDPAYDAHEFALSFGAATRPWLIPLSATEPAPFGPSVDGWRLSKRDEKKESERQGGGDDGESPETAPASPDLDLDGAEERIVPFPVASGRYRDLRAAKGGVLWIRESDDAGVLGARNAGVEGDGETNSLQFWSFDERRTTDVAEKVDAYAVSGDGQRVVIRSGDGLTTQPATAKPTDEPGPGGSTEIDLSRMRYEVDPRAQWRQMFEENARIMRDHYWRADMNGVDWEAVVARWRPVVERIATHDDLTDLLWETVGELNTSHAYISPPWQPGDTSRRLGFLGADLSPAEEGWRIDRILPGESSDPDARSPLRAAGVDARAGDVVVAVDGRPVDPAVGPAANLAGAAERPVELALRRAGADTDRRVVVVPLADESVLRYQDWVASRRDYVAEKSGGRLGYVHVPDMTSNGWAQMFRDLRQAVRCEGLVVDVRFNGGGHTSQLVISRLARRIIGWDVARHHERPMPYPDNAPRGSVVLVTNEHAGSDGDIVNAAAQALGVGPVVGVRTWGGVVGIDGRFDLVDGTSITQPRYAFWLEGPGWDVENHGVDPDIEVWHTPGDYFGDADKQLDAAIAASFRRLAETPAATPPELPEPRVRQA